MTKLDLRVAQRQSPSPFMSCICAPMFIALSSISLNCLVAWER
jgi:hypothetical protein